MNVARSARVSSNLFHTYVTFTQLAARPYIAHKIRTGALDARLAAAILSLFEGRPRGPLAEVANRVELRRNEFSRLPSSFVINGVKGIRELAAPILAHFVSVPPEWGWFLLNCADALQARTIVEVGACIGISGSYLAAGRSCRTFLTFEPGSALAEIASASLKQVRPESHVVAQRFEDSFESVTHLLRDGLDLAYIDSIHDAHSTVGPIQRLVPYLRSGSLLIVDDIRWSKVMWHHWLKVRELPGVSCTIDLGRMGLCLWGGDQNRAHLDLSLLLGYWRIQKR